MNDRDNNSYKSRISFLEIFRNNYKIIIFVLIFFVVVTYPVPYYVFTSGGITDLGDRFKIDEEYSQKGSYNLSYVSQRNGTLYTYLLSYLISDWDLVEKEKYQVSEDESFEEMLIRDKLSLLQANQSALFLAYSKAGKDPVVKGVDFYIVATYDFLTSDEKIKIGDKLLKIDDIEIKDFDDISNYINTKKDGDYVLLTLERNEKDVNVKTRVNEINGDKLIGLLFYRIMDLEVNPKIEFTFAESESGSSAGLMTTLAIYDALIEDDLTNGLKIAGTGTISLDGSVGEIGGVKYKIGGAEKGGASIFFVPSGENYEEAIKVKKERGYKIDIIEVKTFDDAVNYLRSLKSDS